MGSRPKSVNNDMDKIKSNIAALVDLLEADRDSSYLPNRVVSFNPSNGGDIKELLHEVGPEGMFEIAGVLMKASQADIDGAQNG